MGTFADRHFSKQRGTLPQQRAERALAVLGIGNNGAILMRPARQRQRHPNVRGSASGGTRRPCLSACSSWLWLGGLAILFSSIGVFAGFCVAGGYSRTREAAPSPGPTAAMGTSPSDITPLLCSLDPGSQDWDLAEASLICGLGLPQSEETSVQESLDVLNAWTRRIRAETEQSLPRYWRAPGEYRNSEAYFRMLVLVTVLQRDIGVRYDPELADSPIMKDMQSTEFFRDSRNAFLHGILPERKLGTCSTMPVLVVAVARRLGYPLRLVKTKGHLFCRWHDPDGEERFNIDCAGRGLGCFEDDHYRRWPLPVTAQEIKRDNLLKSLTRHEELALLLENRGLCLLEHDCLEEAEFAFAYAHLLAPHIAQHRMSLSIALERDWHRGKS